MTAKKILSAVLSAFILVIIISAGYKGEAAEGEYTYRCDSFMTIWRWNVKKYTIPMITMQEQTVYIIQKDFQEKEQWK